MMKCAARIKPGFLPHFIISLSQAWGQRVLCCPKRGTSRPPLFCVWEGRGFGSRLPPRSVLNGAHRAPGPPAPHFSAAASVGRWATSHRDVAAPKGEPSRQPTRGLQKARSRLPLWGRWTRVSEDGEGKTPPRTRANGSHRRERSSPPQGATCQGCNPRDLPGVQPLRCGALS